MSVAGGERTAEAVNIRRQLLGLGQTAGTTNGAAEQSVEDAEEQQIQRDLAEVAEEVHQKSVDDPIRMYLSQMGNIPLLTRDEEVRLAKKIETTRMIFRRRCLESDYVVSQVVEILKMVRGGQLPFDRTMRVSTADPRSREKITRRIPGNLPTPEKLLGTLKTELKEGA